MDRCLWQWCSKPIGCSWMMSHFLFGVLETVDFSLSFLFGFMNWEVCLYSCSVHVWLMDRSQVNASVQVWHSQSFNAVNRLYLCKCESTYRFRWPLHVLCLLVNVYPTQIFLFDQLSCPLQWHGTLPHAALILVINFLCFPVSKASAAIGRGSFQSRLYSTRCRKRWTSVTLRCLVRSVTQTHLAASLLPSVIDMHMCVHTHPHSHKHTQTRLGMQALARIGCTGKLSGLLCSHARLLADRDKPLFHSHTPSRYTHASTWQASVGWHKEASTASCEAWLHKKTHFTNTLLSLYCHLNLHKRRCPLNIYIFWVTFESKSILSVPLHPQHPHSHIMRLLNSLNVTNTYYI